MVARRSSPRLRACRLDGILQEVYVSYIMYNDEPRRYAVSVSEARQTLSDLVNRVAYGNERITVVRHGRAVAAIVPMSDVSRLEEIDAGATAGERPSVALPSASPARLAPNRRSAGPRA